MASTKLGLYIEQLDTRNTDDFYGENSVVGISTQKQMIRTKADLSGVNLTSYKLMEPDSFAYVPDTSRRGDKVSLAYNSTEETYLISSISVTFRVKEGSGLLSSYLFMYFNRPEFDRYARFNSWGSARETFSWEDMCDIDIDLPPINIQQKYVDIYNAMLANQRCCEYGLDDLRMICTAYIEALRKKGGLKRIGDYIRPYNEKNTHGSITLEQGINIEKQFITPQRSNTNLRGRKIVRKGMFSYCTQLNNENVAIAYRADEDCVVSSVYDVFEIIDKNQLVPEYLMLWLIRPEFGRFVYWASEGSAYEFLSYNNLADYRIPVPDIKVQQEIANIYNSYTLRREINEQMKRQIKDICPILIKGSMEEGGRI